MVSKSFEFLFDFGGPNSFLAHKVLPELCEETGATVTYVPILLGGLFKITNNQAPMIRYAETPAKRNYEMLEFDRFVKAHDLPFQMNPNFPINSLHLMRGAVAAQHLGCFMPVRSAPPSSRCVPATSRRLVQKFVSKRGAFGVPTFFVGNEMFWGKERLGQVAEAVRKG